MSIYSYKVKREMPRLFEEAHRAAYFAGDDVTKVAPILDHLLTLEILAFLLTSISAIVEALTLAK
jgi:hypothetical protein